jgi:hypothetical protein
MSKGPGRVERAIEVVFRNNPDQTFSTDELWPFVYPGANRLEKKHRVSIIRAAKGVAERIGWRGRRQERPRGQIIWHNLTDARSYRLAQLRCDFLNNGRSIADLERRLDDPNAYQSEWAGVQPGGIWTLHVEVHKADLAGDTALGDRLRAELTAMVASRQAAFTAKWKSAK